MFAPLIELLAGVLPNVRERTISGAAHVPHLTHPDDYAQVLRDFLFEQDA
jgi:pimeloyl-ACP methyl ester carboxylesterase